MLTLRPGLDLLSGLATRRRKEFSRQMRRFAELGPVALDTARAPIEAAARFEEFLALEAAGWKGRRGTALLSSPATAAFARSVVASRAAADRVRIVSLRVAGAVVASVVCFLEGTTAYSWKIAYDERQARFSPGAQLMLRLPESFAGEGVARIDSCAAADHPMIDHLWRERLRIGTLVVGPQGGGPLHRLGLAAAEAEISARRLARRLRARLARKENRENA